MQAFPIRPYSYFRVTRRARTLCTCIDAKELRTHHGQAEAEQTSREGVWDQFILFFLLNKCEYLRKIPCTKLIKYTLLKWNQGNRRLLYGA